MVAVTICSDFEAPQNKVYHYFQCLPIYLPWTDGPGFSNMWTVNFQLFKLVLEKAEEPETKLPTCWIIEKARESQKNIYFCFIDCAKAFDCVNHNKLWKILKEMGIPDHLACLLRNYMQVKKQQIELNMEQQTGSK